MQRVVEFIDHEWLWQKLLRARLNSPTLICRAILGADHNNFCLRKIVFDVADEVHTNTVWQVIVEEKDVWLLAAQFSLCLVNGTCTCD